MRGETQKKDGGGLCPLLFYGHMTLLLYCASVDTRRIKNTIYGARES